MAFIVVPWQCVNAFSEVDWEVFIMCVCVCVCVLRVCVVCVSSTGP